MASSNGDTWSRILEAARTQFAQKGYNGTGVAGIARAAGVTNAGLYHYVDNKEELLYAVLDEAIAEHLQALERLTGQDLPATEMLQMALDNHLDFVLGKPEAVRVFLSERRFLTGQLEEKYSATIKQYDALFERIITRCLDGASRPEKKLLRFSILGMINWIPEWYDPDGSISKSLVRQFMKRSSLALIEEVTRAPERR
jgi:AcrR family transcriptional regulator